jgi:copper(I)-binding protein
MLKKEVKKVNRLSVLVLMVTLLLSSCAAPQENVMSVRDAWARPAAPGGNGAIYLVIENHTAQTHELVGAAADIADAVEIHESRMSGDVMQMHQLDVVSIGPGAEVVFEPGGLHIMLIGLKQELKTGDEIRVVLDFKNYQDLQVTVPVQDTPASDSDGH